MNQILEPELKEKIYNNKLIENKKPSIRMNNYKLLFVIFSSIAIFLTIFLLIRLYFQNKKEDLSKKLISQYSISTIYANESSSYPFVDSKKLQNNLEKTPFVIGMIKINKISLNYPILSSTTKELLEISLCRFTGPMPNETGNLCIAGHNYVDYKFFSRLHELNINDTIEIYDLTGKMLKYNIFDIYETEPNNINCTNQDTNNNRIVTLLTCNNVNGKRLIVVAKEIL